ncbi:hypothetical protein [Collimonas pratensis]|uniref:hypothetical protein n=1 Tax=Collimonas pratensis TaxID=279113 RepID=UPI000783D6C2|nr:hypothetical protein [Collimonas pratensis]
MNSDDQSLSHKIKMKFGTSPNEPDTQQLAHIKADLKRISDAGRVPTSVEWLVIVKRHCPSCGHYKYAGEDNSDLTTLLKLATKPAGK